MNTENRKILVTGGAGYIGSHTVLELLDAGYEVAVLDNLCNSSLEALKRVQEITGKECTFYKADINDREALDRIFSVEKPFAVIHFAGLKAVGESVQKPLMYYYNNINGTVTMLRAMDAADCRNIIFSSSATVYGVPESVPIPETAKTWTTSPYGSTKLMIENILTDISKADPGWNITLLRYFNPIGAHKSGLIGEDPNGIPNNLVPYIAQVAVGRLEKVSVFGNDYDTVDGTGVRDYIHVVDLAKGHIAALSKMEDGAGLNIYNLGTGNGYSVLQVIDAYSKACGKDIPYSFAPRRAGDVAECYADSSKAARELGWKAELGIEEMCRDSWNWQSKNPQGYNE